MQYEDKKRCYYLLTGQFNTCCYATMRDAKVVSLSRGPHAA